ncbi:MAG: hypothetical protein ACJA2X_000867 [Halocynthiibacter sp.]|jgi:hypothetical protein
MSTLPEGHVMSVADAAQKVARRYLECTMPNCTETHITILQCCIIDVLAAGVTDARFLEDVGENPIYRRKAKSVFKHVGADIIELIERTEGAQRGTSS